MPDAHKGYVAPIGAVLVTKNFIVPSWVGFDIGCGLIAVRIKGKNILEKILLEYQFDAVDLVQRGLTKIVISKDAVHGKNAALIFDNKSESKFQEILEQTRKRMTDEL